MNFKKTIAGICVLAMVGTCGVSVFAEDVTTTTTNVKDETTVTTVGTEEMTDASAAMTEGTTTEESVTTGVTTEATEETTTETAVTDENVNVKDEMVISEDDILTFTGTLSYYPDDVNKTRPVLNLDTPIDAVCNGLSQTITYVRINREDLNYEEGTRLTASGSVMLANAGTGQNVIFLNDCTVTKIDNPDIDIYNQSMTFTFAGHTFNAEKYYYTDTVNGKLIALTVLEEGDNHAMVDLPLVRYSLFYENDTENAKRDISSFVYVDGNELVVDSPIMGVARYVYDETNKRLKLASSIDEPVEPTVTEEQLRKIFADFLVENGYEGNIISFYVGESGDLEARASYTKDSKSVSCTVTKDGVIDGKSSINVLNCKYFELNGVKFFAQLIGGSMNDGTGMGTRELTIYRLSSDGTYIATNLSNIILIDNLTGGISNTNISSIDNWISISGDKLYLNEFISDSKGFSVKTTYTWDKASNKFVTGTPVENFIDVNNGDVWEVTGKLSYETDNSGYKHAILTLDKPIDVIYHNNSEWGVADGTKETVTSVQIADEVNYAEGTRLSVKGTVMIGHTAHHLRHICLTDCFIEPIDNPAPVKPSKKNPAGTGSSPKTGENAVLPVALALTFVAGTAVVAGIKKKKK